MWHKSDHCFTLQWRHNERDCVSNHRRLDGLLNLLFRRRSKKTSKLRVTGLCEGNSPVTSEFPAQRASNAENVSIWWRHHVYIPDICTIYSNLLHTHSIDQFRKSHNALFPHPTMFHSEQKCAHFSSEWCIVGNGTGTFWDLLIESIIFNVVLDRMGTIQLILVAWYTGYIVTSYCDVFEMSTWPLYAIYSIHPMTATKITLND